MKNEKARGDGETMFELKQINRETVDGQRAGSRDKREREHRGSTAEDVQDGQRDGQRDRQAERQMTAGLTVTFLPDPDWIHHQPASQVRPSVPPSIQLSVCLSVCCPSEVVDVPVLHASIFLSPVASLSSPSSRFKTQPPV